MEPLDSQVPHVVKAFESVQVKYDADASPVKGSYYSKIFEESVTFIAQLEDPSGMAPPFEKSWTLGNWKISENHIPIIVGISSGIVILILTLVVLVIWRCCIYKKRIDKNYEIHKSTDDGDRPTATKTLANYPSVLVVSPPKPKSPYTAKHEIIQHSTFRPKVNRLSDDLSQIGRGSYVAFDVPDISDTGSPSTNGSESSRKAIYSEDDPEMRTRSLPSWVRSKTAARGQVAADPEDVTLRTAGIHKSQNLAAAAANASRRHHVLCNDTAALIALSKAKGVSGAQDRLSLVTNEAVLVLDERTAL